MPVMSERADSHESTRRMQEQPGRTRCEGRGDVFGRQGFKSCNDESCRSSGLEADLPGLDAKLLLEGVIIVAHKACHDASAVPRILLRRPQQLQPRLQHLEEVLHTAGEASGMEFKHLYRLMSCLLHNGPSGTDAACNPCIISSPCQGMQLPRRIPPPGPSLPLCR